MKKLLFLALFPLMLQGQVQNSKLAQGLIFNAPLSEYGTLPGAALTSGTLISGAVYKIGHFVTGDDFTNVGASSNANGVTFAASGTTPTTWTNGSILRRQDYYTLDLITGTKGVNTDVYNVMDRNGRGKRSYVLTGSGSVTIADADRYDVGTGDFSISMKIKPTNITDNGKYLINKEDGGVGYGIYQEDDSLCIRFDDGTIDVSGVIGANVLTANTELEFSIVFSRAGNASLYTNRNSTPVGTVAISTAALTLSNAGSIVVGNASAGSAGFSGEISLCRLFNFAYTATQAVNYMKPEYPIENNHYENSSKTWVEVAPTLGTETSILSLAVYNNKLYGGTYPNGKLYEWNGTNAWVEVAPKLGTETHIYSLAVYNNKLYGGSRPYGKLYEAQVNLNNELTLNAEGIGYATNVWQDRLNSLSGTVSVATIQVPAMSELGAVKCNGTSSVIAYSSMPNGLAGNISMSGWINPLYIGGNGQIFSNGKVILYTNSAGYLSFTRNGSTYLNSSASSITVNNWYHFVITSDNAGATKIYINGVLSSSGAAGTPSAATTYYVGRATTAANYFNGAIDDLRFYNRELLPEEITLMYNER